MIRICGLAVEWKMRAEGVKRYTQAYVIGLCKEKGMTNLQLGNLRVKENYNVTRKCRTR